MNVYKKFLFEVLFLLACPKIASRAGKQGEWWERWEWSREGGMGRMWAEVRKYWKKWKNVIE
ncbi:MAG: hypothetical protein IKY41_04970 [Clostridia bacterium]|nr:hypothetical protein [Clostridia bacterium]